MTNRNARPDETYIRLEDTFYDFETGELTVHLKLILQRLGLLDSVDPNDYRHKAIPIDDGGPIRLITLEVQPRL